jgi:N-methylhydantoinase A
MADLTYDVSRTVEQLVADLTPGRVAQVLQSQRAAVEASLADSEIPIIETIISHFADMSYVGQIHALRVPVEREWSPDRMAEAFQQVYAQEYGNTLGDIPVTIVSLKTSGRGIRLQGQRPAGRLVAVTPAVPATTRPVYFDGWRDTAIYDRAQLVSGHVFTGPAIVEQVDTTAVIEPDMRAQVDIFGNILIEMAQ